MGLNPGLLDHWRTFYLLGQCAGFGAGLASTHNKAALKSKICLSLAQGYGRHPMRIQLCTNSFAKLSCQPRLRNERALTTPILERENYICQSHPRQKDTHLLPTPHSNISLLSHPHPTLDVLRHLPLKNCFTAKSFTFDKPNSKQTFNIHQRFTHILGD